MSSDWKAELQKLKRQPIEETLRMQKKEVDTAESHKSELNKLMKLLKSQLTPVVEVFREEGTRTQQPHIHEYKNGYTLVFPIARRGLKPTILKLQFEFQLTGKGCVLKTKREIGETTGPERIIVAPITEEDIHNEIREVIKERQSIILKLKKGELPNQK